MNIVVPVKLVPDLVDELIINDQGTALDPMWVRYKLNELDEHAIEQAILLKENLNAQVIVIAPDMDGADDVLFTASAKGANHLIKLCGAFEQNPSNRFLAHAIAPIVKSLGADLVLTGVQAHNDLDGPLGALLAGMLELPYTGYVTGVHIVDGKAIVNKEYPGGLIAEIELTLPAVLGIQAAERPLSYIAFSRIRQAMKSAALEDRSAPELGIEESPAYKLFKPESAKRATMLTGDIESVAAQIVELFNEVGVR